MSTHQNSLPSKTDSLLLIIKTVIHGKLYSRKSTRKRRVVDHLKVPVRISEILGEGDGEGGGGGGGGTVYRSTCRNWPNFQKLFFKARLPL